MRWFPKKINYKKSDENKKRMRFLFNQAVEDGDDYKLILGFSRTIKQLDLQLATKITYTCSCFIIGYKTLNQTIVVVETTHDLESCLDPIYYKRRDIHKAYRVQMAGDNLVICPDRKNYFRFFVYPVTTDEELYIYSIQEEEANAFKDFFLTEFKK